MSDLRTSPAHMRELLVHLRERESSIPYFYCDHRGLVTIAIGFLVDRDGGTDADGKRLARQLAERADVHFTSGGVPATVAAVESDWQTVKDYGRTHRRAVGGDYRRVARLRIDAASIDNITEPLVQNFCTDLYAKRPFMINYSPKVAMAFVDVRYNPAGVRLYTHACDDLWATLDPRNSSFDLERALVLFERMWAHRGVPRYGYRHFIRSQWLRQGLTEDGTRYVLQSV